MNWMLELLTQELKQMNWMLELLTQEHELDAYSKVDLGGNMKYRIFSTPHQYVHCLRVIFIFPSQSLHMLLTATLIPMPIRIVLMKSACN